MKLCKHYLKAYAIFGKCKETGELLGYTENSFTMGFSATHVRLWSVQSYRIPLDKELTQSEIQEQKNYQSLLLKKLQRDVKDLSVKYSEMEFFIVRLNSKNCPVRLNWKYFNKSKNKYDRRNIQWEMK